MDEDEDGEGLLVQALDVGEFDDESLELDIPPVSGIDYLRRVQHETRKCPSVVTAVLNTEAFRKKQTVTIPNDRACLPAPAGVAPSLSLQLQQVADFADIRQKVARYKARIKHLGDSSSTSQQVLGGFCMPRGDHPEEWRRFCMGPLQPEVASKCVSFASSAAGSFIDNVCDDSGSVVAETGATADADPDCVPAASVAAAQSRVPSDAARNDFGKVGQPPLLRFLVTMDQSLLLKVLDYHVSWLESASEFSQAQGRWLYALLACLEKPLIPEACALLRSLARVCARLRVRTYDTLSREAATDSCDLRALSLVICLVARYFDQKDMADEETA